MGWRFLSFSKSQSENKSENVRIPLRGFQWVKASAFNGLCGAETFASENSMFKFSHYFKADSMNAAKS